MLPCFVDPLVGAKCSLKLAGQWTSCPAGIRCTQVPRYITLAPALTPGSRLAGNFSAPASFCSPIHSHPIHPNLHHSISLLSPLHREAFSRLHPATMASVSRVSNSALRASLNNSAFAGRATGFNAVRCYSAKAQVRIDGGPQLGASIFGHQTYAVGNRP